MKHLVDKELREICEQIVSNLDEAMIPSDDLLRKGKYVGGYETLEDAFCFSVHLDKEYWFQITLDEVREILNGSMEIVDIRAAE